MHSFVFHVQLDFVLLWGFVATIVLTIITTTGQWLGFSRMSLSFLMGTLFTGNRDRAQQIGILLHILVGWLFSFFYALVFESLGMATWWIGLAVGIFHALFILTVLFPLMQHMHPRMASEHQGPTPTRMLEPLGFMGLHYGRRTPLMLLAAHAVFGVVLGIFYAPV